MSRGSNRRPAKVTPEEFEQRWAETFGDDDWRSYVLNLEVAGNDMFGINELVDRRRAGQFTNRDPDAG